MNKLIGLSDFRQNEVVNNIHSMIIQNYIDLVIHEAIMKRYDDKHIAHVILPEAVEKLGNKLKESMDYLHQYISQQYTTLDRVQSKVEWHESALEHEAFIEDYQQKVKDAVAHFDLEQEPK